MTRLLTVAYHHNPQPSCTEGSLDTQTHAPDHSCIGQRTILQNHLSTSAWEQHADKYQKELRSAVKPVRRSSVVVAVQHSPANPLHIGRPSFQQSKKFEKSKTQPHATVKSEACCCAHLGHHHTLFRPVRTRLAYSPFHAVRRRQSLVGTLNCTVLKRYSIVASKETEGSAVGVRASGFGEQYMRGNVVHENRHFVSQRHRHRRIEVRSTLPAPRMRCAASTI